MNQKKPAAQEERSKPQWLSLADEVEQEREMRVELLYYQCARAPVSERRMAGT